MHREKVDALSTKYFGILGSEGDRVGHISNQYPFSGFLGFVLFSIV